jgi:Ca2+-binding RTX toxin-like protein
MPASKLLLSTALASLAVFELSALNGKNGFQVSGAAAGDESGRSVAGAGDVNGDGFDDFIIGAPDASPNGASSGASYVVFGKAGGFLPNLKLSTLNGKNGFRISGAKAHDESGFSVAAAGDVNGDGFDDLIVGAPSVNLAGASSGAAYVLFSRGKTFPANINLSGLTGVNGFRLTGESDYQSLGRSVASAGDVNGDGFNDVIIGGRSPLGGYDVDGSYVVFGKAKGFPASLKSSALNGINGFRIPRETPGDSSGDGVASAGDVNGDGFDDIVVGAPGQRPHGTGSGAAYVIFGKAKGFTPEFDLKKLTGANGFKMNGIVAGAFTGSALATADVNGDGFDDVVVGARGVRDYTGATYVVFGKAKGFVPKLELSTLNGKNGFRLTGASDYDRAGDAVAGGDLNGDGFDDVIVGASSADATSTRFASGITYVLYGKAVGFAANIGLSKLNGRDGFRINGEAADDSSGEAVGSADVNGDGFADVVIGASSANSNGVDSGASYVVFGQATGPINRVGTSANEFFAGGSFADTLNGAGGNDRLVGNGGKDTLIGGPGKDVLIGGPNGDQLTGGSAADKFVYLRTTDSKPSEPDGITDFKSAESDRIDLSAIDAIASTPADNAFAFIGANAFSKPGKAGELRFSGGVLQGDTNGDRVADISIKVHVTGVLGTGQINK